MSIKSKNDKPTKTIYLFPEHENFQVGKSRLHKGAVFETNFLWILFILVLSLGGIWGSGYGLRMSLQYFQSGTETRGILLDCRVQQGSKSSTTYIRYEYFVNGQRYETEDAVENYDFCRNFTLGREETVYYLAHQPHVSRLEAFVTGGEWWATACAGSMGLAGLAYSFSLMMQNRRERYHYARLQEHSDAIVEAKVVNLGVVTGKSGYHYARYQFAAPKGNYLNGELRSNRQYKWPKEIQQGDTVYVLYLDDETFCVL